MPLLLQPRPASTLGSPSAVGIRVAEPPERHCERAPGPAEFDSSTAVNSQLVAVCSCGACRGPDDACGRLDSQWSSFASGSGPPISVRSPTYVCPSNAIWYQCLSSSTRAMHGRCCTSLVTRPLGLRQHATAPASRGRTGTSRDAAVCVNWRCRKAWCPGHLLTTAVDLYKYLSQKIDDVLEWILCQLRAFVASLTLGKERRAGRAHCLRYAYYY